MKSAKEVRESKNAKIQQKIKNDSELINIELLEVEKVLNKYEDSEEDIKPYITIPLIIKSQTVKDLLTKEGYYIDKISNDIEVNTTRIYLSKIDYDIATRRDVNGIADMNKNQENFAKEYKSEWVGNKDWNITYEDFIARNKTELEEGYYDKLLNLNALGLVKLIKSLDKMKYKVGY